jgi:hypothetical protein
MAHKIKGIIVFDDSCCKNLENPHVITGQIPDLAETFRCKCLQVTSKKAYTKWL